MSLTLTNNSETGQASGTTVTVGNNTGAGSTFDSITINATCTCTYSSVAYRGSLGYAVSSGGTSGQGAVNWTTSIGTAIPRAYGRILVNASSFSAAHPFLRLRGGAAVQVARLAFDTSGHVGIRNSSNSSVGTSSTALSVNQWYLIQFDIAVGASATANVYIHTDPTSLLPAETLTVTGVNFGTNSVNEFNAGIGASTLNVPTFHFDDLVLTDVGLPGPSLINLTDTTGVLRILNARDQIAAGATVTDTPAKTLRVLNARDTVSAGVNVTDQSRPPRVLSAHDQVSAGVSLTDQARPGRVLHPVDAVAAGASVTDQARPGRALSALDQITAGVALSDLARAVRGLSAADSVTAGANVADLPAAARALAALDSVSAGASLTDRAKFLRALAAGDQVSAGAALTDIAAAVRVLSACDQVSAGAGLTDRAHLVRVLSAVDQITVTGGGPRPTHTSVLAATVADSALGATSSGSRLTAHM